MAGTETGIMEVGAQIHIGEEVAQELRRTGAREGMVFRGVGEVVMPVDGVGVQTMEEVATEARTTCHQRKTTEAVGVTGRDRETETVNEIDAAIEVALVDTIAVAHHAIVTVISAVKLIRLGRRMHPIAPHDMNVRALPT